MVVQALSMEFRGVSSKLTRSGNKVYNVAFEDTNNNQITLYVGQDCSKFNELKKGDIVDLLLEYNFKYGSLKLLDCRKVENGK